MRRPSFLFMHGWGFDAGFWDPVRRALPEADVTVLEHGYSGRQRHELGGLAVPAGTIAVGHSAGVLDLLCELPAACGGLVAINGFSRFTLGPDFPHGVPARVLDRMAGRLAADPSGVIGAFWIRCGADAQPRGMHGSPVAARLETGLERLRGRDARRPLAELDLPVLALAGANDPVVPAALTRACFGDRTIVWNDAAGHVLPLSQPQWCAEQLQAFALA